MANHQKLSLDGQVAEEFIDGSSGGERRDRITLNDLNTIANQYLSICSADNSPPVHLRDLDATELKRPLKSQRDKTPNEDYENNQTLKHPSEHNDSDFAYTMASKKL